MTENFESSILYPWFIFNNKTFGFDTDLLIQEFLKTKYIKIYNSTTEKILDALKSLIQQIIDDSFQYEKITELTKRFQLIINGSILEFYLNKAIALKLKRNSDSKWLFNGAYEVGADFVNEEGLGVEAKVYYSAESMTNKIIEANEGNHYIFHEASFVCCYLIKTRTYQWIRRTNSVYETFNDPNLDKLTSDSMPKTLPLCRCEEDFQTGEWILKSYYYN
jgi:hypothetical protein